MGPQLAAAPIKPLSPLEVVRVLFHFISTEEDWCPILERGVGQKSISDALLPDASLSPEEHKAVIDNWCQVLVSKDLVISYRGSTITVVDTLLSTTKSNEEYSLRVVVGKIISNKVLKNVVKTIMFKIW